MKHLSIPILLLIIFFHSNAQLTLPELSPSGKIIQQVGYANFEISYGRPAVHGRKIFGELVPYGLVWRTGGGAAIKLQFDKAVTIGGKVIPAGEYAIVSIPTIDRWTIMINSDTKKIFGAQQDPYDLKTEIVRFEVPVKRTERFYESFTLDLDIVNNDAELYISWENTQVHFSMLTNSNAIAIAKINSFLSDNPDDIDNISHAVYYINMNKLEPQRVLIYIDRALKIREDGWFYELKMNLLADAKRMDEARKTYQEAITYLHRDKPENWKDMEQHLKSIVEKW